ncbi:MAG TPA: helix-turn-helix transcriptional regulator [Devosia sp.]|jgi:transcriptional regulator with XRE-family HTH domain|uniref:helix-turn-helix domain-containing protein n=1 Tax=Devosia sp. TaxID=1871048 RepID=UPI002DDD81C4|nr:helix-turn-helix transcriptional regulator [Devosia sp.]HEV2517703.1 helix-turn-helix transcriptional regulator [Devosia sp.]
MTYPTDPHERLPRGDKNRRLSLGASREEMAAAAGITVEQLHDYEHTQPDRHFSIAVARRVGDALERLEATQAPHVYNGPVPSDDAD